MTKEPQHDIADRLAALEEKLTAKPKRTFPTAAVLALLPIAFGLYQFHLSNEFKQEDNQTRALLAALEGESPSAICGNLSLLVQGGLVTGERLEATQSLIDEITRTDQQQVDGGLGQFDCLPRIAGPDSSSPSQALPLRTVSQEARANAPTACFYDAVRLEVIPQHDPQMIKSISTYLETEDITFAENQITPTEWEVNNYAGQIWYYSIDARRCAKSISDDLALQGITLTPRYYTRPNLPENLPIRIWPQP